MILERVYTMTDFYDGPRGGIADFEGRPHLYESEWDDLADNYASTFRLSPVTPEVLALALEDWAIWERWLAAFNAGETTQDTHPALPADRARHEELQRALHGRLQVDPETYVRARGDFEWEGSGAGPSAVTWERCG